MIRLAKARGEITVEGGLAGSRRRSATRTSWDMLNPLPEGPTLVDLRKLSDVEPAVTPSAPRAQADSG